MTTLTRFRAGGVVLWLVVGAVAVVGGITLLLPTLCKSRESANLVKCSSNLHQFGQAIDLYQHDHGGVYPASFQTILATEKVTPAVFVCPSSNDEPAEPGMSLSTPHRCSYVYCGAGLTDKTVKADTVVAYEPPANHDDQGMNVLYGDGHAEWVGGKSGADLFKKLKATTQPTTRLSLYDPPVD